MTRTACILESWDGDKSKHLETQITFLLNRWHLVLAAWCCCASSAVRDTNMTFLGICMIRCLGSEAHIKADTTAGHSYFVQLCIMFRHKFVATLAVALVAALALPSPIQAFGSKWKARDAAS